MTLTQIDFTVTKFFPPFPAITPLLMRTAFTESTALPKLSTSRRSCYHLPLPHYVLSWPLCRGRLSHSFQSSGDDNCDREICSCLGDAVTSAVPGSCRCWKRWQAGAVKCRVFIKEARADLPTMGVIALSHLLVWGYQQRENKYLQVILAEAK